MMCLLLRAFQVEINDLQTARKWQNLTRKVTWIHYTTL